MSSVDERIVRMEFDNAGFEAGATKAVDILNKLDDALNMDGATEGLEDIQRRISNFNMDAIGSSIDEAGSSFSWLEQIGIGVLRRIGDEVAGLGLKLLNNLGASLTRGVTDGFKEYEQQMRAVQTISANSGESLGVIQKNLDELNEYADKTSYVFSDMTSAIGRFTAAGLEVDQSTKAIQGFFNAAALSGAGASEASRGVYQLSQAMSAGVVKLQDWKSIESASIDTDKFRKIIMMTAEHLGVTDEKFQQAAAGSMSFRESLSSGWLTADVMQAALENLTMSTLDYEDAQEGMNERIKELVSSGYSEEEARQIIEIATAADKSAREIRTWSQMIETMGESIASGWAETWRLIIGNSEQATEVFTWLSDKISGVISASANARNAVLQQWQELGGRDALIGAVTNMVEAITRIVRPIVDAFGDVFGITGKQLAIFTENLALFTEKLVISEEAAGLLYSVFSSLFTMVHSVIGVVGNFVRVIVSVGKVVWSVVSPFVKIAAVIFDRVLFVLSAITVRIQAFSDFLQRNLSRTLDRVSDFLGVIGGKIFDAFTWFMNFAANSRLFGFLVDGFKLVEKAIGSVAGYVEKFVLYIDSAMGKATDFVSSFSIGSNVKSFGTTFVTQATDYLKGSKILSKSKAILTPFAQRVLPIVSSAFSKFKTKAAEFVDMMRNKIAGIDFGKIKNTIANFAAGVVESIKKISPSVLTGLQNFGSGIVKTFHEITDNAKSFSEVIANVRKVIDEKLANLPEPVKKLFEQIASSFAWGKDKISSEIGKLSLDNLQTNLSNAGNLVGTAVSSFVDGIVSIPDIAGNVFNDIINTANSFIGDFPSFDEIANIGDKLLKGGLIVSLVQFVQSLKNLNKTFAGLGTGIINWPKEFGNALSRFGEGFNAWRKETKADAVLKIAGALAILAGSLFILASIPANDLERAGRAMGVMAVGLGAFLGIIVLLDNFKKLNPATLTAVGAAIGGLGIGVLALAGAAAVLALIPQDKLASAVPILIELVAAISMYAFALRSNGGSLLKGSIGLVIFAGALNLLVGVVDKMGGMDKGKLDQGVQAFMDVMIALSIFGAFGAKGISDLLASFIKFGAGVAMLSASLVVLGIGVKVLSDSLNEIDNLPEVLGLVGGAIVSFVGICFLLKSVDPMSVGLALLAFSGSVMIVSIAMAALASIDIGKALAGVVGIAALLAEFAGITKFTQGGDLAGTAIGIGLFAGAVLILSAAFKVLETVDIMAMLPSLGAVIVMLAAFAVGAAALSPAAIGILAIGNAMLVFSIAVLALAAAFWIFSEAIKNLNDVGPEQIAEVMGGFGEGLGKILDELIARMPDFITALVQGIMNSLGALASVAFEVVAHFATFLIENTDQILAVGAAILSAFWEGIQSVWNVISEIGPKIIADIVAGLGAFIGELATVGGQAMSVFIGSLSAAGGRVKATAGSLVTQAKAGVASLATQLRARAVDAMNRFVSSISSSAGKVRTAANTLVTSAVNAVRNLASKMYTAGVNGIRGFINGFGSLAGALYNKALSIGQSALGAIKKALGIKSPSREMRKLGRYGGQGLALGFDDEEDEVRAAVEGIVDAVKNTIAQLSFDIDDLVETDYSPVITPTINTAEFDSSLDYLSMRMNAGLRDNFNIDRVNYSGELINQMSDFNKLGQKMSDAMSENAIDYTLLGQSVANALIASGVRVEMDSGELVGYLAGEVRSARRSYGVM